MDCNSPDSTVHGIFHAKYWSGLPFPSPGDLPDPVIKQESPRSPTLQANSLLLSHWGIYIYYTHTHTPYDTILQKSERHFLSERKK